MSETHATASDGTQANTEQSLTQPVTTSVKVTPTLTFGDIGQVAEQELGGYEGKAHAPGEFSDEFLLERIVALSDETWTVDDTTTTLLANFDVDSLLRNYARNKKILDLYRFYRADIELTLKLNTNQFFYGAIMVTMIPGDATGETLSERAVQDPTIISASLADSVVKTWKWSWPSPWRALAGNDVNAHPVHVYIDILHALRVAKDGMATSIPIQLWARFRNMTLAYPYGPNPGDIEAQSGPFRGGTSRAGGSAKAVKIGGRSSKFPAFDPLAGVADDAKNVVDAVTSIPSKLIDGALSSADDFLSSGIGEALGWLFDRPDDAESQTPANIESSQDYFCTNMKDTNVFIGLKQGAYVNPSPSRIPNSKDFTLAAYAQIPGIRAILDFVDATPKVIDLIPTTFSESALRTPLDYACLCAYLKSGPIKLHFYFFTSTFITARFAVQLKRKESGLGFDNEYDYGLSHVVNVKGDTEASLEIPWLELVWWLKADRRQIQLKALSVIVSPDVTVDPHIYCTVWIAAGDNFQFCFPKTPTALEWAAPEPEAQSSPGKVFLSKFPPIVDGVFFDKDEGFCTAERVESMVALAKRYTGLNLHADPDTLFSPLTVFFDAMNTRVTPGASAKYAFYVAWRNSFYGAMRACFLDQSGGYRARLHRQEANSIIWRPYDVDTGNPIPGTVYLHPFDSVSRMTVPQVNSQPFYMFDNSSTEIPLLGLGLSAEVLSAETRILSISAREDVQFGYPILPTGVPKRWIEPGPVMAPSGKPLVTSLLRESRDLRKENRGIRRKGELY